MNVSVHIYDLNEKTRAEFVELIAAFNGKLINYVTAQDETQFSMAFPSSLEYSKFETALRKVYKEKVFQQ